MCDSRQIAVDPTFGHVPNRAVYIQLITGDIDQHAKLISVTGKIRVEGIAYR
ncbi:MAG: hypothetical protein M0Z71_12905 [Nitrospiraceae bacterium]|nr:hypothetical protein [Nitrospiraceae bacterium]